MHTYVHVQTLMLSHAEITLFARWRAPRPAAWRPQTTAGSSWVPRYPPSSLHKVPVPAACLFLAAFTVVSAKVSAVVMLFAHLNSNCTLRQVVLVIYLMHDVCVSHKW